MPIVVNNHEVEAFNFSGGECHVKLPLQLIGDDTHIQANLYNSDDVMTLLLTVDAARRLNSQTKINLTIPYFPYARQDRVCNKGEALSVKVMADLINALNCDRVTVLDPHSEVTPALINNCHVLSLADIILDSSLKSIIESENLTLLSPDAGAEKKVHAVAKKLSMGSQSIDILCASKTRDTATGNITSTYIHGTAEGKDILILDDICDGGRTFIEIAKLLKHMHARNIYLYVTHGIFSNGLAALEEYFNHVYCYHTFLKPDQIQSDFITILKNHSIGE